MDDVAREERFKEERAAVAAAVEDMLDRVRSRLARVTPPDALAAVVVVVAIERSEECDVRLERGSNCETDGGEEEKVTCVGEEMKGIST